jgi:bifunctional pyridoxal-dependent enzyme with beta-cystathionase and maltose regulon repressor activities
MDYSNAWLLKLQNRYIQENNKNPMFISDWDISNGKANFPDVLIQKALAIPAKDALKYIFSEDLTDLKLKIKQLYKSSGFDLMDTGISIVASPTTALYITIQTLSKLGVKKILVFTPVYYSLIDSLKDLGISIIYYHLNDVDNFSIDFNKLRETIEEQEVEAIVISDPIYSCGIGISATDYGNLIEMSSSFSVWLLVDYALGGMSWQEGSDEPFIKSKMASTYSKCILIESITKRLVINGLKSCLIFSNQQITDQIEIHGSQVYGGLTLPQITLLKEIYELDRFSDVIAIIKRNIEVVQDNYKMLKAFLLDSDFNLYSSNSGYFSMIVHKTLRIKDVDSKTMISRYLFEEGILAFPSFHFSLYKQNHFGFRINLLQDLLPFFDPLSNCIRKNMELLN